MELLITHVVCQMTRLKSLSLSLNSLQTLRVRIGRPSFLLLTTYLSSPLALG